MNEQGIKKAYHFWVFDGQTSLEDAFETGCYTHEEAFRHWHGQADAGRSVTMHVLCRETLEVKTFEGKSELVLTLVSPKAPEKPPVKGYAYDASADAYVMRDRSGAL